LLYTLTGRARPPGDDLRSKKEVFEMRKPVFLVLTAAIILTCAPVYAGGPYGGPPVAPPVFGVGPTGLSNLMNRINGMTQRVTEILNRKRLVDSVALSGIMHEISSELAETADIVAQGNFGGGNFAATQKVGDEIQDTERRLEILGRQ
jgi:hypothetical protein